MIVFHASIQWERKGREITVVKERGGKKGENKTEKEKVRPTANQWMIKTLMLSAN